MPNISLSPTVLHLADRFEKAVQKLPRIAGNTAVNFALENFRRQGFQGAVFQPWRTRKDPTKWGQRPKRNGRAVLVMSGRLRQSVRIVSATANEVTVGSDVPYAKVHNEGFRDVPIHQWVKSYTRKHTYAGVAGSFKVMQGDGQKETFATGAAMSLKTRKAVKNKKVQTSVTVKAHLRTIIQNIPARPFLADSPYLQQQLKRNLSLEILKALKP